MKLVLVLVILGLVLVAALALAPERSVTAALGGASTTVHEAPPDQAAPEELPAPARSAREEAQLAPTTEDPAPTSATPGDKVPLRTYLDQWPEGRLVNRIVDGEVLKLPENSTIAEVQTFVGQVLEVVRAYAELTPADSDRVILDASFELLKKCKEVEAAVWPQWEEPMRYYSWPPMMLKTKKKAGKK